MVLTMTFQSEARLSALDIESAIWFLDRTPLYGTSSGRVKRRNGSSSYGSSLVYTLREERSWTDDVPGTESPGS